MSLSRRVWLALGVIGVVLGLMAPAAQAAECGSKPDDTNEPVLGSLVLKTEESVASLDFGSSSELDELIFIFDVKNCTLASEGGIVAEPHVAKIKDAFEPARIKVLGSTLTVEIPVKGEKVDPGKHSAAIAIGGPAINTTVFKAPIQRKSDPLVAILIALAAMVGGVVIAIYVAKTDSEKPTKVKLSRLPLVLFPAALASGAVLVASYFEADLWVAGLSSGGALVIGAGSAALGAVGGLLLTKKVLVEVGKDPAG